MDGRLAAIDAVEADQGIDFEVGEVEVDVDGVEADEEVDEGLLLFGGDVSQEGGGNGCAGWEGCADGDGEGEGLGVNVPDVDTAFVREEDEVAFAHGVDADVVLGV